MQCLQRQLLITKLLPLFLILPMMSHEAIAKEAPLARPALTVNVIQAQRITLPLKVFANGNIAAWQEAIVGSEANGLRLTQVYVNIGDTVSKGQLLAEFSDEAVLADLNQAKAKLMEAEAQGHEALANAERARTLQNTGAMSSQQIDQYLTAADTAKARVEVARAVVQTQQIQLKNTKIYAPDSGVISARTATVGAVISAGSELFRLIRQSRLEWRAEVVSADIAKVKVGMQVNITGADGSKFSGKVRKLSPTVDMQTRNSLIYVDLPSNNTAKAGMYAKGEFVSGQSSALAIPQQALVLRDGFTYVFVVKSEQGRTIVKQMKVQPGRRLLNLVEIVSGLQAQQSVVALGGAFLSDNDVVKVVSAISIKK
ncbi:MAG: efflux RND transporter periplasmic adaptor subunit [Methylophilales bacterium]|nr:efflux RND transporter periplasmic adaptor subunit [Methylophilales bacterium]